MLNELDATISIGDCEVTNFEVFVSSSHPKITVAQCDIYQKKLLANVIWW